MCAANSALGPRLDALRGTIRENSTPGALSGLFLRYLFAQLHVPFIWDVGLTDDAWESLTHERHFATVASIGFELALAPHRRRLIDIFTRCLGWLRSRNAFPDDRATFAFLPQAFLGLSVGCRALGMPAVEHLEWLRDVFRKLPEQSDALSSRLLYTMVEKVLFDRAAPIPDAVPAKCGDMAAFILAHELGFVVSRCSGNTRELFLHDLIEQSQTPSDTVIAGMQYAAAESIIRAYAASLVPSAASVAVVLERFQTSMRRWRWDEAVKWPVLSEREVQDVLWALLVAAFPDVIDEETLQKVAHSSFRSDFAVPSARTLVEVKFCRSRADFKKVEHEILVDATAYFANLSGYDSMVVFIYDDSCSTQEYEILRRDLEKIGSIASVVIASRPSQLPTVPNQKIQMERS